MWSFAPRSQAQDVWGLTGPRQGDICLWMCANQCVNNIRDLKWGKDFSLIFNNIALICKLAAQLCLLTRIILQQKRYLRLSLKQIFCNLNVPLFNKAGSFMALYCQDGCLNCRCWENLCWCYTVVLTYVGQTVCSWGPIFSLQLWDLAESGFPVHSLGPGCSAVLRCD